MKRKIDLRSWDFKIRELNFEKRVTLPHTWNVEENRQVQLYRGEAEYETTVELGALEDRRAILYFGCAYHTANVIVNDRPAGRHTGSGNTPFEFDITDCLKDGENKIRVLVDNKSKSEMLPHMLDYDWADDGGLTRSVVLTICDEADLFYMAADYTIESMGDGLCSGEINLRVEAKPQSVELEITDYGTGEAVIRSAAFLDGSLSVPFKGLKLWSPDSPSLYTVSLRGENDEISKRIGFRKIEVSGAKVLLNGNKTYLKGCEWMPGSHPDYGMAEPLEHSIKCLSQLKEAGCVFTRFHWQQDTSLFDWCDENGLLVQEEIPYWGHPKAATPMQLELAKRQAEEMVRSHAHHPSIVCWGVGNELGGELPQTIDYVKNMYAFFKSLDGSRLVNYVSNSLSRDDNVELDDATLYGDIAMWNEYLGLWQPCSDVEGVIRRTYEKCADMPSLVSEFGLCEPAFEGGDERRTEILSERIPIYRSLENMVGYVWFSLNDYRTHCGEFGEGRLRQRIHGSTDLYGVEKPSYKVFKEID